MNHPRPALALLQPGEPFPPLSQAWPEGSPAPGLIAAGGALDVPTLVAAYTNTIFPWFSEGEPILWWSPDPRMVLQVQQFRLHRSLRKAIQRFRADAACEIRVDTAFDAVIDACAGAWRRGPSGTWIGPEMRAAHAALHRRHGLPLIDCQQNTAHLAFMGAAEMPRADFAAAVQALVPQPAPAWHFEPVYWNALMPPSPADR